MVTLTSSHWTPLLSWTSSADSLPGADIGCRREREGEGGAWFGQGKRHGDGRRLGLLWIRGRLPRLASR